MKNNPFTGKSTRTKIFTVVSVVAIILIFLLNVFVTGFGIFGNFYIDLTPEGLYTLTSTMKEVCEEVFYTSDGELREPGIKITFCNDPDNLISNVHTRVIYYMATALSHEFENCEVETVNVKMNPTAVAQYKTTSLTEISTTDVIVSYGSRYSIVSADKFWHFSSEGATYAYDGEYKLASVMLSLTLVDRPVAYFVTDHGETYYDTVNTENEMNRETGAFAALLMEKGFEIKTLSISELVSEAQAQSAASGKQTEPDIPEDCVLLIINNPTSDFTSESDKFGSFAYCSETEVLDRFMTANRGSVMVSLDYRINLPNLEDWLAEWGISSTGNLVTDAVNSVENERGDDTSLIADYNLEEDTYAYNIYGDYASISSSPRVIVGDAGSIVSAWGDSAGSNESGSSRTARIFAPFLYSSSSSKAYAQNDYDGRYNVLAAEGRQAVAAVSGRETIDSYTGEYSYSYVFFTASTELLSSDSLGNSSYANYDIISALVQNIARLETHADSALGGLSMNNSDDSFAGKMLVDNSIRSADEVTSKYNPDGTTTTYTYYGLTSARITVIMIIIFAVPLIIAAVGAVLCIKRKYL